MSTILRKCYAERDLWCNRPARRTQFLKRMVQFADWSGLEVRLVYYPPYHSKYNPIERCWSSLEKKWNGVLLNCWEVVLQCVRRMTWKRRHPTVTCLQGEYPNGVRVAAKEMKSTRRDWNDRRPYRSTTSPSPKDRVAGKLSSAARLSGALWLPCDARRRGRPSRGGRSSQQARPAVLEYFAPLLRLSISASASFHRPDFIRIWPRVAWSRGSPGVWRRALSIKETPWVSQLVLPGQAAKRDCWR